MKYLGERGKIPCFTSFSVKSEFLYFELKFKVFVMTKIVSNRGICFIKVVLSLCEYGQFSLNFASHDLFCSPPVYVKLYENLK